MTHVIDGDTIVLENREGEIYAVELVPAAGKYWLGLRYDREYRALELPELQVQSKSDIDTRRLWAQEKEEAQKGDCICNEGWICDEHPEEPAEH